MERRSVFQLCSSLQNSSEQQQQARTYRSHTLTVEFHAAILRISYTYVEVVALSEALASHFTKRTSEIRKTPTCLNSAPVFNHVEVLDEADFLSPADRRKHSAVI